MATQQQIKNLYNASAWLSKSPVPQAKKLSSILGQRAQSLEITRINTTPSARGGASPEYGQTLAAIALTPVIAHTVVPAMAAINLGAAAPSAGLIASTGAKVGIGKVALLGGGLLGAGLLASIFGGQKASQQQQQEAATTQTGGGSKTFDFSRRTSYTGPVTSDYQVIAGRDAFGGDVGQTPSSSAAGSPMALEGLVSGTSQGETAEVKQSSTDWMTLLIIGGIAIAGIMLLSGGMKE